MIGSSGSRISSRCSASHSLCEVVELCGIVDQHLPAYVVGYVLETAVDRLAALRPRGRGLREVRAPQERLDTRVLARLQPRRVVPPDHVALPLEELRGDGVVALGVQPLPLELVIGELELVRAPGERRL